MKEGINTLAPQAENELTPTQEEVLQNLFPEGPQSDEDRLLLNKLTVEMATGTDNIDEVIQKFREEREALLAKGGYNPEDYVVEKGGIVEKGATVDKDGTIVH